MYVDLLVYLSVSYKENDPRLLDTVRLIRVKHSLVMLLSNFSMSHRYLPLSFRLKVKMVTANTPCSFPALMENLPFMACLTWETDIRFAHVNFPSSLQKCLAIVPAVVGYLHSTVTFSPGCASRVTGRLTPANQSIEAFCSVETSECWCRFPNYIYFRQVVFMLQWSSLNMTELFKKKSIN